MRKVSLILIIFFLLCQNIRAESLGLLEALKKVDENKTLTFKEKEKVKAKIRYDRYWEWNYKLETEADDRRKEENKVWELIIEKDYVAALQRVKSVKALGLWNHLLIPKIIALKMETDDSTPKDKVSAFELKIKQMELDLLSLELDLRNIKDNELLLINSRRDIDISRIEMRLLDLEERLK